MERFRRLGINESIMKIIGRENFEKPSEIQEKSIPIILSGKDVIAGSATGSGKTLAFAVGIIHKVERGKGIQALVMTPTRELAEQVSGEIKKFSSHNPISIVPIYGGVSINPQIDYLKTADVVVGTPGRILDHLERKTIDLRKIKILVLDEADRMADMGFINDVEKIIHHCGKERQTMLFSATITEVIRSISDRYMKSPVRVAVTQYVDPKKMTQVYYNIPANQKISLLVHLLKKEESHLVMIFSNTRQNADFIERNLRINGIEAIVIHGGFSQKQRTDTINKFHKIKSGILICTDVAARGLDIKDVSHIYNYDIPRDSKEYIHRIGRTARAGKEGKVINILCPMDHDNFSRVLRDNDVKITQHPIPQLERIKIYTRERESGGFQRRGFGHGPGRREGEESRYGGERRFGGERRYGGGRRDSDSAESKFGVRRDSNPKPKKPKFGI